MTQILSNIYTILLVLSAVYWEKNDRLLADFYYDYSPCDRYPSIGYKLRLSALAKIQSHCSELSMCGNVMENSLERNNNYKEKK